MYYIASPYTAENDPHLQDDRYKAVRAFVAHLAHKRNHYVFSPIVHWHEIAKAENLEADYLYWKAYNESLIKAFEGIIILALPGWRESKGVNHEINFAKAHNKVILIADPYSYEISDYEA